MDDNSTADDLVLEQIRQGMLVMGLSAEQAGDAFRQTLRAMGRLSDKEDRQIEVAVARLKKQIGAVTYLKPAYTIARNREPWYSGPAAQDELWPAYRRRLEKELAWPEGVVDTIDRTSTRIVSLLDNPGLQEFSTRGLVVGYVQSGKTANMSAVMAKAADTGYRLIIVLAGLTNALRSQTQERLQRDLFETAPGRLKWYPLTNIEQDFKAPAAGAFDAPSNTVRRIAVVKKNKFVLEALRKTFKRTDDSILRQLPVLVVDDECDQASVNASSYSDDMTRINELVRSILQGLPRVAYIGYTATPFANILIDPAVPVDPEKPDDLYPKDFIVALPRPEAYFGAERLFGRDLLSADDELEEGEDLDQIRLIPDDEAEILSPKREERYTWALEVTPSLRRAILYFLLASAVRRLRGQRGEHSSMLLHNTLYTAPHLRAREDLTRFLEQIGRDFEQGQAGLIDELSALLEEEQARLPPCTLGYESCSFAELREPLREIIADVEVVAENSLSDDRIDYSKVESPDGTPQGRCLIVVGGNVLARGLTLEGLVVSFFLRSSSQYDTLMQMGRWFGYRSGYEDLPRIWMSEEVRDAFKDLATVEAEIRQDIAVYAESGDQMTPLEFAVRIRQIPGMAITARNKMRAATECQISFSGQHVQTTSFRHRSREWLESNWQAGGRLLEEAMDSGAKVRNGLRSGVVLHRVPVNLILAFLERYSIHPRHVHMERQLLFDYIRRQNEDAGGALARWNVGVVAGTSQRPADLASHRIGKLPMVIRSAHPREFSGDADIKALMSRGDILIDFVGEAAPDANRSWQELKKARMDDPEANRPLLLLYPIDPESAPRPSSRTRRKLSAKHPVLGVGVVFPESPIPTPVKYVAAPIQLEDEDLSDEYETGVGAEREGADA